MSFYAQPKIYKNVNVYFNLRLLDKLIESVPKINKLFSIVWQM